MFDHRLADPLGNCDVFLICIVLKASHRFLLTVPCMFDSPYLLWGQQASVFSELHLALRGAPRGKGVKELRGNTGVLRDAPKSNKAVRVRRKAEAAVRNAEVARSIAPATAAQNAVSTRVRAGWIPLR